MQDLEQSLMAKVPAVSTGSGDETGMSER